MSTIEIGILTGPDDGHEHQDGTSFSHTDPTVYGKAEPNPAFRWNGGLRFTSVPVPNGQTLDEAYLIVYPSVLTNDDPNLDIYCNDVDDANDFSTEPDVTSRVVTSASVPWVDTGLGTGAVNSPDISAPLEEVFARPGWASGQSVAPIMRGRSDFFSDFRIDSYDGDPTEAAVLHLRYIPLTTISPAGIASLEAFGATGLFYPISPAGIASAEAFGTAQIDLTVSVSPTGIISAEAFGATRIVAAWDRYTTLETSFEVQVYKGLTFKPRFYCDDNSFAALPDNLKPYLRKAPVAKLAVTPRVQFVNVNFTWDISASRSPTSTISTYSIFFNGSPTDLVDQSWAGVKTGVMAYDAVGEYVVDAYVEDILGLRSQTNSIMVKVIEQVERAYIGTTDSGVYVLEPGSTPVTANSGLSGDYLKLRALHMHPAYRDLPANQQHLWIATAAGLAFSTDGAQSWTTIDKTALGAPENAVGDSPTPATSELDQIDLAFDPQDAKRLYLVRTKSATPKRAWLYYSDDYGSTWSNEQISLA